MADLRITRTSEVQKVDGVRDEAGNVILTLDGIAHQLDATEAAAVANWILATSPPLARQ